MRAKVIELPALGMKSRYADVNPSIMFISFTTLPIYLKMRTNEANALRILTGLLTPILMSL